MGLLSSIRPPCKGFYRPSSFRFGEARRFQIEEWHRQRHIYATETSYSLDLAFATLFLNRTNRSGILNAGPIGGYSQSGDWKIDVRFNKNTLISKISAIADHRQNITVYNKDIISLLRNYAPRFGNNVFFYFDPPYYNKGQKLYKNFLIIKIISEFVM